MIDTQALTVLMAADELDFRIYDALACQICQNLVPENVAPPDASLVNYKAGVQNIANAATIKTFVQVSSEEISVINRFGFGHLVIDVLGYYYPMP